MVSLLKLAEITEVSNATLGAQQRDKVFSEQGSILLGTNNAHAFFYHFCWECS